MSGKQLAAFAVQSGRRIPERHARDPFDQYLCLSCLYRNAAELRQRGQGDAAVESTVVQGHVHSHGCRRDRRWKHCKSRVRDSTNSRHPESRGRDGWPTTRGPVPARSFPDQRCRCQDKTGAKQGRVRPHGWWSESSIQDLYCR